MQIRHDPRNEKACATREALLALLGDRPLPAGVCLVLGGDGFLLRCIRELGAGPTYLGVNCGRMGFMLNDVPSLPELVEALDSGAWSVLTAPRLRMEAVGPEGEALSDVAVNDIYLERSSGQTAHLRVSVDGAQVVERLVCDGVIASTALGSTAYALAAGGVACHTSLGLTQLVAINPHVPRLPPIALPRESVIDVEVIDGHRRPVRGVSDGQEHAEVRRVRIRDAHSDVHLAFLEGHDFTATLVRKLLSH